MLIPFLIAKIHNACVTGADVSYTGSISVDSDLIKQAGLREYQKVEVYNISNGNRFSTYLMAAESGSKEFVVNGAAARLVSIGDKIIIAAYALLDERELNSLSATIILMDDHNNVERIINGKI